MNILLVVAVIAFTLLVIKLILKLERDHENLSEEEKAEWQNFGM